MDKKRIISWSLDVRWYDGKEENLTEIDDTTASCVDDYLTGIEEEKEEKLPEEVLVKTWNYENG